MTDCCVPPPHKMSTQIRTDISGEYVAVRDLLRYFFKFMDNEQLGNLAKTFRRANVVPVQIRKLNTREFYVCETKDVDRVYEWCESVRFEEISGLSPLETLLLKQSMPRNHVHSVNALALTELRTKMDHLHELMGREPLKNAGVKRKVRDDNDNTDTSDDEDEATVKERVAKRLNELFSVVRKGWFEELSHEDNAIPFLRGTRAVKDSWDRTENKNLKLDVCLKEITNGTFKEFSVEEGLTLLGFRPYYISFNKARYAPVETRFFIYLAQNGINRMCKMYENDLPSNDLKLCRSRIRQRMAIGKFLQECPNYRKLIEQRIFYMPGQAISMKFTVKVRETLKPYLDELAKLKL